MRNSHHHPSASFAHNLTTTVEDADENSCNSGSGSSRHNIHGGGGGGGGNGGASNSGSQVQQPRMKRSPYLSVMAGSTKEQEDLVAMLSRPAAAGGGGLKRSSLDYGTAGAGVTPGGAQGDEPMAQGGGGSQAGLSAVDSQLTSPGGVGAGRSTFFDLKRPSSANPIMMGGMMMGNATPGGGLGGDQEPGASRTVTPVSSAGGEFSDGQDPEGGGNNNNNNNPDMPPPAQRTLQPSLRSALRVGSRSNLRGGMGSVSNLRGSIPSRSDLRMNNNAGPPNNVQSEMKKNTSVTFSNATKQASVLGMTEERGGNARFFFNQDQGNQNQFMDTDQQMQQQSGGGVRFGDDAQQQQRARQQANLLQFQQSQAANQPQRPQGNNYSAQMMMKKSQSIAAPQFMLAHQNSNASSSNTAGSNNNNANESFGDSSAGTQVAQGGQAGAAGNASFPIYFSKLPEQGDNGGGGQGQGQAGPSPSQQQQHRRMHSKSTNTLRYCYQNPANAAMDPAQKLLHAAGMAAPASRPSVNGLNLTFREMLDVGDGAEGDLNLRSRNQQWKDFRSFSSKFENDNPMMTAAAEMEHQDGNGGGQGGNDQGMDTSVREAESVGSASTAGAGGGGIPLSGSKRTLTPNSLTSRTSASTAASSKAPEANGNAFPFASGGGMPLAGSHRASVSVNDLGLLRRAAARMKMNGPTPQMNMMGGQQGQQQRRQSSTKKLGETLGGDMLSRIPSSRMGSSSTNSSQDLADMGGFGGNNANGASGALSPLAQMMAKNSAAKSSRMSNTSLNRMASTSNTSQGNLGAFANQQQKDLFFQKFNLAVGGNENGARMGGGAGGGNNPAAPFGMASSASGIGLNAGMGRRSRTVGAGLAYGRANMTVDYKSGHRLSRFDLGDLRKETSRLSGISSEGSSGGGKNEEWDLS